MTPGKRQKILLIFFIRPVDVLFVTQTAPPDKLNFLFYRFLSSKGLTASAVTSFLIFYMWMIVTKYRSVALAGIIITIYLAVELSFSIPVGHLIDRVNNTKLNFISTFFIIAGFSILIFSEGLLWIYVSATISVLGQTLKTDSFSAIIKKHLPEGAFRKANSANTAASSISSLLGTIVGGFFIITAPGYFAYFLVAISTVSLLVSFPSQEKSYENSWPVNSRRNQVSFFIPEKDCTITYHSLAA
jgi:MFS family permease